MEAADVRSSFLATTVRLTEDLELSSHDHDAAQAVSDGLRDAKAANTRRVYQTAWHLFCEWTLLTGRQSMPAEPQTVALYLGDLAADGKAMATIEQARAAISHAHAAEGTAKGDNPARHPVVAETVKGWRNQAPAPSPPRPWHASGRPPDFPGAAAEDGWRGGRRRFLCFAFHTFLPQGCRQRTRRAYDQAWRRFVAWTEARGAILTLNIRP